MKLLLSPLFRKADCRPSNKIFMRLSTPFPCLLFFSDLQKSFFERGATDIGIGGKVSYTGKMRDSQVQEAHHFMNNSNGQMYSLVDKIFPLSFEDVVYIWLFTQFMKVLSEVLLRVPAWKPMDCAGICRAFCR